MNIHTGIATALIFAIALIGCGSDEEASNETDRSAERDSAARELINTTQDVEGLAKAWLQNRYGPEYGTIQYRVTGDGDTLSQTRYFSDHGAREANWLRMGPGEDAPTHVNVLDSNRYFFRGPADSITRSEPWRPDPNMTLPNFMNLTDQMRTVYSIEELEERTYLDRTCRGWKLNFGETVSTIWTWEGILMYGELQGIPEKQIEPMVVEAMSIDTSEKPDEEKFRVPSS